MDLPERPGPGPAAPRVVICHTLMGRGVPFLEARDKTHFIRVEEDEWARALDELEAGAG